MSTDPEEFDRQSDDDHEQPEPSLTRLLLQTLVFTVAVFGLIAFSGYVFREPLADLAEWMVYEVGLVGIFVGVFLADTFTFPIPPDFYLFFGVASGTSNLWVVAVVALASVIAGNAAYALGPYIQRIPLLRKRIEYFRDRGEALFEKYGTWAVGLAALTPVPFSVVCWMAGIYRMPYSRFWASTFIRIPRMVGYYYLFQLGWTPSLL